MTLEVGAEQSFALAPPSSPSVAEYAVEVQDAAGSRVLRISGLELSEVDNLRAGVPLELTPAGDYDARLHELDGDRRDQL